MADKYIKLEDAQANLEEAIDDDWEMDYAIDRLNEIPTADVRLVVHGRWIDNKCTACGRRWDADMQDNADDWGYFDPMPSFCPNCGADMRQTDDE